jgi:hypothetical protein
VEGLKLSATAGKPAGVRRRAQGAILAVAGALAALLLAASPASAAFDHSVVEDEFPVGGGCNSVTDIAVLEPEGLVYLSCRIGSYPNEEDHILRFHLNGDPAPFNATEPYISGNQLIADPGSENGKFISPVEIAVDSSPSPNHGRLYVNSAPHVDIFNVSGVHAGQIFQPIETTIPNILSGIDVGPDGFVYVTSWLPGGRISMYNTAYQEIRRLYTAKETFFSTVDHIRVDTTGAVWTRKDGIRKYEADQFTEELRPKFGVPVPERAFATPSPYVADPLVAGGFFGLGRFDVDLTDNDLYLDRKNHVEIYSQGTPAESSYLDAPPFGAGKLAESEAIAVTKDHHVYASTSGAKIVIFGPGNVLPDIRTQKTDINQVGHTDATLHGRVEMAGGSPIVSCKLEYVQTTEEKPSSYPNSVPCSPDPAESPPGSNFTTDTEVSAHPTGLTTGATYHYRFSAENEDGKNVGIDRVVVPAFVLKLQTLAASNVDTEGATLNASFDPDGMATQYHFEYGLSDEYGLETGTQATGATSGLTNVGIPVETLPSGRVFHYRVVASNGNGTTFGPDMTFRTASKPDISAVHASEVSASSALLQAEINPVGYPTEYFFEYGPTTSYGNQVPLAGEPIGEGTEPVPVKQRITGLQEGVTYHYRVVATNVPWGTAVSADTTFDFAPPSCPNGHVRQESGASYLPDCRAYELVSPVSSGSELLYPGEHVFAHGCEFCINPWNIGAQYPSNQGFASSPGRFTYYGGLSALPGTNPPTSTTDMYMATRTNTGWVTTVPGLQGKEAFETGRKECSEAMDECIDHSETEFAGFHQEFAPYRFSAEGERRGRLPTNFALIPGARGFHGMQVMSRDFSHYVFSSSTYMEGFFGGTVKPAIVFAPGGQSGGLGSAYDNNIRTHTVEVISKLPGGEPIPSESNRTPEEKAIDFRGVSADGSRILMETPANPPTSEWAYLFLRVNDAVTYDISQGEKAIPIGMTRDGSKVFFTTEAQLSPSDTDASVDLYQWREDGSELGEYKVLSQGNGQGDSDECSPSWSVSGCGVDFLKTQQAHPYGNAAVSARGMDDQFAEDSGDIYFYSPEVLDSEHPGVRNEKNLYVYRSGSVHLVATLDKGTDITRMQISPDGRFAAIRTKSALTSHPTNGFQQIYTYNADTGLIRCASCNPSGAPPTADVRASQNGRFMADDGRTFFSTQDRLDPRDQDGEITDVYEYVDGRPQLITSGQGNRDFTGGSEVFNLLSSAAYTGLEGVSHDGVDVFFSTYDTLVGRDHNGEYVKFYDARTGGGFSEEPELLPCEAADECHGGDSSPPPPPLINSAGNLGGSGNIAHPKRHRKKVHRKRRARHKHRTKRRHRSARRHTTRRSNG